VILHDGDQTILVPRAAILLASATDRELWQGPKTASPRIANFQLSAQPQKFETITVTIGYKNGQLLRLRVILALSIRGAGQKDRISGDENETKRIADSGDKNDVITKQNGTS